MKSTYSLAAARLQEVACHPLKSVSFHKTGKHYLAALLMLLCATSSLFSQVVTWTGAINNDWATGGNWSGGEVPYHLTRVVIPNTANDPVISSGQWMSNLTVQSGAVLTINNATLIIYSSTPEVTVLNQGTITNNGWIWINNDFQWLATSSETGIKNEGVFNNNSTGTVFMLYTNVGLWNTTGTFINKGNLTVSGATDIGIRNAGGTLSNQSDGEFSLTGGSVCFYNETNFTNNGLIELNNSSQCGIEQVTGAFTNRGTIKVGAGNSTGLYGIKNNTTFNNEAGEIDISRFTSSGFLNAGTFTNSAKLYIGYPSGAYPTGISNTGILNNNGAGEITIERAATQAILNAANATVNNAARILIQDVIGLPLENGIKNEGGFNNNSGGEVRVFAFTSIGIWNEAGAFNNSGSIIITCDNPGNSLNSRCIYNKATFNNNMGGGISANNSTLYGIEHALGTFTNVGTISIGSTGAVGSIGLISRSAFNNNSGGTIHVNNSTDYGIENVSGNFLNGGNINIGSLSSVGAYGLRNSANFINNTGGQIVINRCSTFGLRNNAGSFTNTSTLTIGSLADIGSTGISNAATINNNFGGIINIDRPTIRGIINAAGATFANVAAININNTSANTMDYGIDNSGTFTNNWSGDIRIDGSTAAGLLNNGGSFTNTATVTIGSLAAVGDRGIYNTANGTFNNSGGTIKTDNSILYGIELVSGTFSNSATIQIGSLSTVGVYGLRNSAAFNNTGGQITINRCTSFGLRNNAGTFTNAATLTIGALAAVGTTGISNAATINNNAGGIINIDRASVRGIYNVTGTISNTGTIRIGALDASSIQYGIDNSAIFENNTGGQLHIDRFSNSGISTSAGTFTNEAGITIGALEPVTNLITSNTGTFSNSTGGTLKGTGNITSAHFTNDGGTLSPGYSPGKMTFTGDESFSNNTLAMEVNGTGTPGVNFDQVVVNGVATLGGTLALTFNYTPSNGNQIPILNATSRSGTFANVTGLPAGWTVNYTPTGVTLNFGALPVEMIDFTARPIEKPQPAILLEWATATEHNNEGFDVEHSVDGLNWSVLGFVAGHGTTTQTNRYAFLHEEPLSRVHYYRLRQVDFDGHFEYSNMVKVEMAGSKAAPVLSPNPAVETVQVRFPQEFSKGALDVFDMAGRLVISQSLEAGVSSLQLQTANLISGTYLCRIELDGVVFQKRLQIY